MPTRQPCRRPSCRVQTNINRQTRAGMRIKTDIPAKADRQIKSNLSNQKNMIREDVRGLFGGPEEARGKQDKMTAGRQRAGGAGSVQMERVVGDIVPDGKVIGSP